MTKPAKPKRKKGRAGLTQAQRIAFGVPLRDEPGNGPRIIPHHSRMGVAAAGPVKCR